MARKSTKTDAVQDSKNCAALAVRSPVLAAQAMQTFSGFHGRLELADLIKELKDVSTEISNGDMNRIEKVLATQTILLDTIFGNLLCRAEKCETLKPMETYMRLAMKAQAQSRATAESLALVKNPQPYIKQANIAAGPQQVNNGYPVQAGPHAEETRKEPIELLEAQDEQRLDSRAAASAGGGHQEMETMGAGNRPGDSGRQGHRFPELMEGWP